jgi:hypothetical protein
MRENIQLAVSADIKQAARRIIRSSRESVAVREEPSMVHNKHR